VDYYLLALVLSVAGAVVIDLVSYKRMPVSRRHGFYPNLPLWGIGLLMGLCINFLGMLSKVIMEPSQQGSGNLPQSTWDYFYQLSQLAVPTVLLALTILSVAKICHRE
jgi:hypothetical protein